MAKVDVERGNVVLTINDDEVDYYMEKGYSLVDGAGKVIRAAVPNDLCSLQRYYADAQKRIEELETQVANLTAENKRLSKKIQKQSSIS